MPAPRPPALITDCTSTRAARSAGATPKSIALSQRDHQREEQHRGIERRLLEPGHAGRCGGHERLDAPRREADADDGRDEREDDAFGEELPGDPRPARAEGGADGELAGARGAACQQQVGDVAAGDEEHEADRAEKREHAARVVADEIVEHGDRREVELGRLAREGAAETLGVGAQLAERLFVGRPGLQPRVDLQVVLVVHRLALGRERDRHPELFAVGGVVERRRHDADDVVGASVERDAAPDRRRIAAEPPRPEAVAEHGDLFASGLILLLREHAAVRRRQIEDAEVAGRDPAADQPLGVVAVRQVEARELLGSDGAERADWLDAVDEVARRDVVAIVADELVDREQSIRVREGEWLQHHRPDRTEDGRGRADAECERQHRDEAEARVLEELPAGEGDVLRELSEVLRAAHAVVPLPCQARGRSRSVKPIDRGMDGRRHLRGRGLAEILRELVWYSMFALLRDRPLSCWILAGGSPFSFPCSLLY